MRGFINKQNNNIPIISFSNGFSKRFIAFIFSLLLIFYNILFYHQIDIYAMADPIGETTTSSSNLWSVIDGGLSGFDKDIIEIPTTLFLEFANTLFLGSVARSAYWDDVNAEIRKKINDGTLNSEDVGVVWYKEVDGQRVPYCIKSSFYGYNTYLLTDELANKIIEERRTSDDEIEQAVHDYWERVAISNKQPFIDLATDVNNWAVSFKGSCDSLLTDTLEFYKRNFNSDGYEQVVPDFQSAKTWVLVRKYYQNMLPDNNYNQYYQPDNYYYCVLRCPKTGLFEDELPSFQFSVLRIKKDTFEGDITIGNTVTVTKYPPSNKYYNPPYDIFINPLFRIFDITGSAFSIRNNYTLSKEEVCNLIGIDPDDIPDPEFWQMPYIVLAPELDPLVTSGVNYNVGALQALDDSATPAADQAIENNSDPYNLPILDPVDYPSVPSPTPWEEIAADTYPSENPITTPLPNPDSGDNGDGGDGGDGGDVPPGGGDDGGGERPGERPKLKVPLLLTLFPFCIPFDIKNAIQLFSADGSNPVFNVPIHIEYGGHVIVDYTFVLDLTSYGISTAVGYIKAVEVIAYIIVLCFATYKVIY